MMTNSIRQWLFKWWHLVEFKSRSSRVDLINSTGLIAMFEICSLEEIKKLYRVDNRYYQCLDLRILWSNEFSYK